MASECRTFDHTADVGLEARADTLAELLAAMAEGLADVVLNRSAVRPVEAKAVDVEAEDVEALLVDLLSDVLRMIQVDRFAVAEVRVVAADAEGAIARVTGEDLDPARHIVKTEVKAVTYHMLRVVRTAGGWHGRVILDL